jgi:hypothetical protein
MSLISVTLNLKVPEDSIRNPRNLSITELEFDEAQRLGRPILLFVMSDEHDVKPKDVEPDPAKRAKLNAFNDRAKNISADSKVHRIYATFDSLEDFARKAIQSVSDLAGRLWYSFYERGAQMSGVATPAR